MDKLSELTLHCEPKEVVQFYDHETRELRNQQRIKAEKFLEHGCITWSPTMKVWFCAPIDNYNSRTYTIRQVGSGDKRSFICNCQQFVKVIALGNAESSQCSHIKALWMYLTSVHNQNRDVCVQPIEA